MWQLFIYPLAKSWFYLWRAVALKKKWKHDFYPFDVCLMGAMTVIRTTFSRIRCFSLHTVLLLARPTYLPAACHYSECHSSEGHSAQFHSTVLNNGLQTAEWFSIVPQSVILNLIILSVIFSSIVMLYRVPFTLLWRTRVVRFKSNLLLSSQMYNMLSLHKYN